MKRIWGKVNNKQIGDDDIPVDVSWMKEKQNRTTESNKYLQRHTQLSKHSKKLKISESDQEIVDTAKKLLNIKEPCFYYLLTLYKYIDIKKKQLCYN